MVTYNFTDKYLRSKFRSEFEHQSWTKYGETEEEKFTRLYDFLIQNNIRMTVSGKTMYDNWGNKNNCTNLDWPDRIKWLTWARSHHPIIFQRKFPVVPERNEPVIDKPEPVTVPAGTGWDDFDWSK